METNFKSHTILSCCYGNLHLYLSICCQESTRICSSDHFGNNGQDFVNRVFVTRYTCIYTSPLTYDLLLLGCLLMEVERLRPLLPLTTDSVSRVVRSLGSLGFLRKDQRYRGRGRKGGREGGREGGKEGGREGGREQGGREGGREGEKEGGK